MWNQGPRVDSSYGGEYNMELRKPSTSETGHLTNGKIGALRTGTSPDDLLLNKGACLDEWPDTGNFLT